ncbi:hypothetical protein MMC07_007963 [Pseudocyphellaria aurata]|nr:hypothetical protein [Pseudocyphellaria aurata]
MSSKNSQTTQNQSSNTSQPSKDTGAKPSMYSQVKSGWGSRQNFQASFGLGMDPDSIDEGNSILEAMAEADRSAGQGGKAAK